ncbi:MAG: integration host factor subunit beta [Pseudomonadota bacterium]
MTRSELVARLTNRYPQLIQKDTELVVAEILGAIQLALVQGSRVEIRGFGTFDLIYRAPRIGRNPKTGESVSVPGKWVPHFKAGKPLRTRVDNLVKSGRTK